MVSKGMHGLYHSVLQYTECMWLLINPRGGSVWARGWVTDRRPFGFWVVVGWGCTHVH
jgi:hypothetical protein